MQLYDLLGRFKCDENGAVTVDWVVLTAGVIGICLAVLTIVGDASDDYADEIGNVMSSKGIRTTK